ncbi:MAG: hypothetical protein RSE12_08645 [Fuscovulum sp.]|nr:MAG: hypothetical protein RSE12_08645 [Fuscovulum sp.]
MVFFLLKRDLGEKSDVVEDESQWCQRHMAIRPVVMHHAQRLISEEPRVLEADCNSKNCGNASYPSFAARPLAEIDGSA